MQEINSSINTSNAKDALFYLAKSLNCLGAYERQILPIIDLITKSDNLLISPYEFSLRIKNGKIERSIRFVYFDKESYLHPAIYLRRILLIERVLSLALKDKYSHRQGRKLLSIFKGLVNLKLSIFVGIEKRFNSRINIKLYLNMSNYINTDIPDKILGLIFKNFNISVDTKRGLYPLVSFDLGNTGRGLNFKIYYLYKKVKKEIEYLDFSVTEKKVYDYLKKYNRNSYISISKRYINGRYLSRKIEIGIKSGINYRKITHNLLALTKNNGAYKKILEITNLAGGKLNYVVVEGSVLSLYFR